MEGKGEAALYNGNREKEWEQISLLLPNLCYDSAVIHVFSIALFVIKPVI